MKTRNLGLLLPLILLASQAHGRDEHVALVKNVAGSVRVERSGSEIAAVAGTTLLVSDRLHSGAGASAGIVFKDGTLVTLGAESDLQVRDYLFDPASARYAFDVYLAKGSAIYSSGKIGKIAPESVKVGTPSSTVAVRGTRFIIEAH
jgi:hypothetical protein